MNKYKDTHSTKYLLFALEPYSEHFLGQVNYDKISKLMSLLHSMKNQSKLEFCSLSASELIPPDSSNEKFIN